ncbi:hypothetical protein HELRODRAFT_163574 [Helobdella robusta]|uniref:RING-type E3 ubiquitin transferase n=1 Tax=Helobdella robusta TaxID=6412 RepID=T1EU83_HELRO|nr:hypothetical protein HELRODRAFT_163574 [Helobdella robusta]ESN96505.1 hypothetical protein HELRODRAFT_163574 [Helobdella robusta]
MSKSPERLSSSPIDPNNSSQCSICLGSIDLQLRSVISVCFHEFCFICIKEWSKTNAVCPLCKQSFTKIFHNIRSDEDYDVYNVVVVGRRTASSFSPALHSHRGETHYRYFPHNRLSYSPPGLQNVRWRYFGLSPSNGVTSISRRNLYLQNLWTKKMISNCTQAEKFCQTGANFYRKYPACCHRLAPWLNRELNGLFSYGSSNVNVSDLMQKILDLIKVHDITSAEFYNEMEPIFQENTRHFIYEFFSFARTPYDMETYDSNIKYSPNADTRVYNMIISGNNNNPIVVSDDGNSVPRVIPPPPTSSPIASTSFQNDMRPPISRNRISGRNSGRSNFKVAFSGKLVFQNSSAASSDVEVISPPTATITITATASNSGNKSSNNKKNNKSNNKNNNNNNYDVVDGEDDEEEVEIVGMEKPWSSRSPVTILDDDDDDDHKNGNSSKSNSSRSKNNHQTNTSSKGPGSKQTTLENNFLDGYDCSDDDDDDDCDDGFIEFLKVVKPVAVVAPNQKNISKKMELLCSDSTDQSDSDKYDHCDDLPSPSSSSLLLSSSPSKTSTDNTLSASSSTSPKIMSTLTSSSSSSKKLQPSTSSSSFSSSHDVDEDDDDDDVVETLYEEKNGKRKLKSEVGFHNLNSLFKKHCTGHKNSKKSG